MSAVAQERETDLADIDQIDRIESHLAERQVECAFVDYTRRLAQVFMHEAGWTQMRPRQARFLEIFLNFLVHETKRERGVRASVQARELDHMTNARGLARVNERVLSFDHIHAGS